jgi:hypothetical protein
MNLLDALRHAEQQGKAKVQSGAEKLRNKLSGHPGHPAAAYSDPEQDRDLPARSNVRTGIVSVNGRDVEKIHCTGGRRPS